MKLIWFAKKGFYIFISNFVTVLLGSVLVSVGLLGISGYLMFTLSLDRMFGVINPKDKVFIYLDENINNVLLKKLKDKIQAEEGVTDLNYIPKEQAINEFKEMFPQLADEVLKITKHPIPDIFEVTLESGHVHKFVNKIKFFEGVNSVDWGGGMFPETMKYVKMMRLFSDIVAFILLCAIILSSVLAVVFTVSKRKDEIEIMNLVGATRSFITIPYSISGLFQGILSSVVFLSFIFILKKIFPEIMFINLSSIFAISVFGILISVVSSYITCYRMIK